MKPVNGPCPRCGGCVSGSQLKVTARAGVFLVCGSCGAETEGATADGGRRVEFNPADMRTAPPEARP